jgi:hypothetical protein
MYPNETVTTYIHVVVYHVPFFLEKYGCLDFYGNYSSEGKHQHNKKARRTATGSPGKNENTTICMQIQHRDVRLYAPDSSARKFRDKEKEEKEKRKEKREAKRARDEAAGKIQPRKKRAREEGKVWSQQAVSPPRPWIVTSVTAEDVNDVIS